MKTDIVELYSDADIARLEGQIRRWRLACVLLATAALTACLAMIALTRTANAARMEGLVIAVSTAAGWIVIYAYLFVIAARKRELGHARRLRSEAREAVRGAVAVTDERVVIRRSITARRVEVRGEGEVRRLLVCETRAGALEGLNAATLYTVHGYVAAYEVSP